jgi:hypothetical protein
MNVICASTIVRVSSSILFFPKIAMVFEKRIPIKAPNHIPISTMLKNDNIPVMIRISK